MGVQAATEERQRLLDEKAFGPDTQMGLLHGRLNADEKAAALEAFADGRTPVLIATSVVEVTANWILHVYSSSCLLRQLAALLSRPFVPYLPLHR